MTEFITRNYGGKEYEVIIKTDNHEHYQASQDFARILIDHGKNMTNADKLRTMSNKELAWFLAERYANESVMTVRDKGHNPTATEIKALHETLYHIWLRWLLTPVEGIQ